MNSLDPLPQKTATLVSALTSVRSTATAADGLIQVHASADGEISVNIDDKLLVLGGAGLSKLITELAAHALRTARTNAHAALAEFRSDPRVAGAVAHTVDAMNTPFQVQPLPHNTSHRSGDEHPPQSEPGWPARAEGEFTHRNSWGR
ncbi:YbaB/EbfC family nucleoid-associated protein [Nocardia canadensis]|uniref:YbaB/EbfC family nucleoid-associated protein n=1 Tax=Nocardia canadensis TaxID=3065238 RepID=UPI00292E76DA|nr:YbaB/EbfC family nucleoid-associated protein [Nocardia canadensis]